MISALYVEKDGVYFNLPDVDPWDETRDARLYKGPFPVVAHPPCQRCGRFWHGKGVKADDCCVAYVDYHCHCLLDGANDFDKEWLEGQFHKANTRTMRILFRNGIVK